MVAADNGQWAELLGPLMCLLCSFHSYCTTALWKPGHRGGTMSSVFFPDLMWLP
jgi:hypothetical protein